LHSKLSVGGLSSSQCQMIIAGVKIRSLRSQFEVPW
jgi:hypothetical protein